MYLKNLEIRGFKSFADRTDLDFRSGITAVVGPNGSGKSNISDAVRWVLGEQSIKQLRGGKMEDVIFAGTQYRRPLGQASVSLTLDNSCGSLAVPYNEVTVTRRLYRSGESEYLINNQSVRLKDIHELFMDTGIGREGYSMIGQGKIDAILSGKNEERRVLVEEAAGITKFKVRKEESERKLARSEENLVRVDDIISTYQERIGPLEKERDKAREFLSLSTNLKSLQISLALRDLENLERSQEQLESEAHLAKLEMDQALLEKNKGEEKEQHLNDALDELAGLRRTRREEYFAFRSTVEENSSLKTLKEENLRHLEGEHHRNEATLEREEVRLTELNSQKIHRLKERKEQLEILATAQSHYQKVLQKSENQTAALEKNEAESQTLRDQLLGIEKESQRLQQALADLDRSENYLRARQDQLAELSSNFETSHRLNEAGKKNMEGEVAKLQTQVFEEREALQIAGEKLLDLRSVADKERARLEELSRSYRDAKTQVQLLSSLADAHEGYAKSVKDLFGALKRQKSPLLGRIAILGEVIQTEPKYALAIESALGAAVGNVITESEEEAKELIALLKKNRLGRATFLPRNVIRAKRAPYPTFHQVKVLGFASDLVQCDEKYREIIDANLARTLVCENLDDAVIAARESGHRLRIVTLEGDIIAAGGAMSGGSRKGSGAGVVSRASQLKELEENMASLSQAGQEQKERSLKASARVKEAEDAKILAQEALQTSQFELSRAQERLESFQKELEKSGQALAQRAKEEADFEEICQNNAKKRAALRKDLAEKKNREKELSEQLQRLKEKRRLGYLTMDELRDELADVRVNLAKDESQVNRLEETLKSIEEEEHQSQENLRQAKAEAEGLKEKMAELKEAIENLAKDLLNQEAQLQQLDALEEELEIKETVAKASLKEAVNQLQTLRQEFSEKEKQHLKASYALEQFSGKQEEILRHVNEDLELTLAEAKDLAEEIEDEEQARSQVRQYKNKISRLGSVNTGAIEEYEKVAKDYEFLSRQREDLTNTKMELEGLIAETTKKMRSLFRENFVLLNKNFQDTFRSLFNGGAAELVLGEGDELTGTIDIQVQPPGKKLQNINLLSGGEKVLSAIALTFAILRMKPSPFCFLDEIEAALDDANVYRYATFLKEFAQDTQFILITHRKGTMEAADVLYGVTMEEKGISKIVSVDLTEIEEAV